MTRPCDFCQKDTAYVPLTITSTRKFEVHYCYDCGAEFVENTGGVHLYTEIRGKMYRWSMEEEGTVGRLWSVGEPGVPGIHPNRKMFLIKSFKNPPAITPQNINNKVKLILVFL